MQWCLFQSGVKVEFRWDNDSLYLTVDEKGAHLCLVGSSEDWQRILALVGAQLQDREVVNATSKGHCQNYTPACEHDTGKCDGSCESDPQCVKAVDGSRCIMLADHVGPCVPGSAIKCSNTGDNMPF